MPSLHALVIALLMVIAAFVCAGAWLVVAALRDGHAGWMAVLFVPVVIGLLRLTRVSSGTSRSVLALFATTMAISLANVLVAALPVAQAMDLTPLAAARRIGPDFCWMLVSLGNTPLDWLWAALALALAAWFGR